RFIVAIPMFSIWGSQSCHISAGNESKRQDSNRWIQHATRVERCARILLQMDPSWDRIKGIFQLAIDRSPPDRQAFIIESCEGDEELQKEVESLIQVSEMDSSFMESPAELPQSAVPRDFRTGELIADRFEILNKIRKG